MLCLLGGDQGRPVALSLREKSSSKSTRACDRDRASLQVESIEPLLGELCLPSIRISCAAPHPQLERAPLRKTWESRSSSVLYYPDHDKWFPLNSRTSGSPLARS